MYNKEVLVEEINKIGQKYGLNLDSGNTRNLQEFLSQIEEDAHILREKIAILNYLQENSPSVDPQVLDTTPEVVESISQEILENTNEASSTEFEEEIFTENESEKELTSSTNTNSAETIIASETKEIKKAENSYALGDQLRKTGIKELSSAIGISEKFLFIKELFKNDTERYLREVNSLNEAPNRANALEKLDVLQQEFEWNTESKAYLQFCGLLERKFPL